MADWFDQNAPPPAPPAQDSLANYEQNYWAPDREQVLADMRAAQAQDTSRRTPGAALPGASGAPVGTASGGGGSQAFGNAWLSSGGRTVQDLKNFVAQHPEYGVTLGGSKGDKVYGPGGQFWADAVISAGTGGNGASWNTDTGGGGSASGGALSGVYLTPYTGQFNTPAYGKEFTLPTLDELQHMPGYQAGLDAASQAVQRGAASNGTLLTGGLQQRLGQVAGDYAQQKYGQLAGLDLQAQQGNYNIFSDQAQRDYQNNVQNKDTFYQNQTNPYTKLMGASQLGLSAQNAAAQNASSYSANAQNNAGQAANAAAGGTVAGANATGGAIGSLATTGISALQAYLDSRKPKAA